MANIIDALVVTLGLDGKGFAAGLKHARSSLKQTSEETDKVAKEMEMRGKQAAMFFSKIRNEALAMLAVFTAGVGIKNFTENTITSASSLGMMSQNLGMSTERLSAWQRAAERAGGSAAGMTSQLQESQQEVEKFRLTGVTDGINKFLQYGGNASDLKDGNTYLLARSRIVANLFKKDPGQAALVAQQMGISTDEFNLIKQGPAAIEALVAAQEKRSSISKKEAADALKLKNRFLDLRDTFTSVGTKVLVDLLPVFDKLIARLQTLGDWLIAHKADISNWVDQAVAAVGKFVTWADKAAKSVGGWQNVLLALGAIKILSIVSPLLSLASALAAIASSLGMIGGASGAAGIAAIGGLGVVAAGAALALTPSTLGAGEPEMINALNHTPANNAQAIAMVRKFMAMGWTQTQATGIVANLQGESSLKFQNVGDNGLAFGLAQWHKPRQDDFKRWAGHDIKTSTEDEQLAFINWELQHTYKRAGDSLRAANSPMAAADVFSRQYEGPLAADKDANARSAIAGALFASMARQSVQGAVDTHFAGVAGSKGTLGSGTFNTSSSDVSITGPITIHTQATDANGIAKDFASSVAKHPFVAQANGGLQ